MGTPLAGGPHLRGEYNSRRLVRWWRKKSGCPISRVRCEKWAAGQWAAEEVDSRGRPRVPFGSELWSLGTNGILR